MKRKKLNPKISTTIRVILGKKTFNPKKSHKKKRSTLIKLKIGLRLMEGASSTGSGISLTSTFSMTPPKKTRFEPLIKSPTSSQSFAATNPTTTSKPI